MADYIKREDIIKWIDDSIEQCGNRYDTSQQNMMDLFRTVVNDCLPFADVVERELYERALSDVIDLSMKQKKGKWKKAYLEHESFGVRPAVVYCSECHLTGYWEPNFCPNCGASMKGE